MKKETEILREICEYLAFKKVFFWRQNNIPVFGRALPKYTPKGLPDMMAIIDGRFLAIEVKRPVGTDEREKNGRTVRGGHLSPQQAEWATQCVLVGGLYFCVHSIDETRDMLHKTFPLAFPESA